MRWAEECSKRFTNDFVNFDSDYSKQQFTWGMRTKGYLDRVRQIWDNTTFPKEAL